MSNNIIKPSIIIYNSFFENGKYKLSPVELYFYALLTVRESKFLGYAETTLNLISQEQSVFNDTNKNRNIHNIKNIIYKLEQLNIIKLDFTDTKLNANTKLKISFPFLGEGYEHIYNDLWSMVASPDELYVLVLIKRFNKNGFQKAREDWASMLGYKSPNTGIAIIDKMIADEKIYCIEGKKISNGKDIRQQPTKWYIGKRPQQEEPSSDIGDEEESQETNIKWGHWLKGNLEDMDYDLYIEQATIEEFRKVADERIKKITSGGNNASATQLIKRKIEEAKKRKRERDLYNQQAPKRRAEEEIKIDKYNIIELDEGDRYEMFDEIFELMINENKVDKIYKIYYQQLSYRFLPSGEELCFEGIRSFNMDEAKKEHGEKKVCDLVRDYFKEHRVLNSFHFEEIHKILNEVKF